MPVRPGLQRRGVGRQLLDASMAYGAGCLRSMVASSDNPLALRRYRLGRRHRPVEFGRPAGAGAAHGADHEVLTRSYRFVVADTMTGAGYAYVAPGGGTYLLAATNRRTATALLWEALAASSPGEPVSVPHLTAVDEWAIDVGMACRLQLWTSGYLALRGMKPPAPYLHSGHFL